MNGPRFLSLGGVLALLGACGGAVATSDTQLAGGAGDAMASLDETATGSKLSRLELPIHALPASLTPGFGRRLREALFPSAYGDSCWLDGFSVCTAGVETRTLSNCNIGPLSLNGTVTLTWSDPSCVLVAAGDSVTRTGAFTVSDDQGAELAITSPGGGQQLTDNGTGYSYKVLGMERVATAGGATLFDISTSTSADLGVSGVSRATRVVNGGTLVIEHNILHYGVALTPDALAWSADCNCAVSGSLSGTLSGNASGSYTLEMTGCGTAKLTVDGKSDNIVLDRCGSI